MHGNRDTADLGGKGVSEERLLVIVGRLRGSWRHQEAGHFICVMVVGKEVENDIIISVGSLLSSSLP